MEPEGSLPHSQEPAISPYPDPDQSSPCPTFHFLKIHFNIILPYTPRIFQWSFPLRYPHPTLYAPFLSPYVLHAPPISFLLIYRPNNNLWGVQSIKLFVMRYLTISCYLVPLSTKYLPQQSILESPQPMTFLNVRDQVSHPHKTRGKIIVSFMYALFNM